MSHSSEPDSGDAGRAEALERLRSLRRPLPQDWRFDRDTAHERAAVGQKDAPHEQERRDA